MAKRGCPHTEARYCPLYHASHGGDLAEFEGCCWGDWAEGCAVERGEMSYKRAVAKMGKTPAGIAVVLGLAAKEREAADRAQRERNMRLMGIR